MFSLEARSALESYMKNRYPGRRFIIDRVSVALDNPGGALTQLETAVNTGEDVWVCCYTNTNLTGGAITETPVDNAPAPVNDALTVESTSAFVRYENAMIVEANGIYHKGQIAITLIGLAGLSNICYVPFWRAALIPE